MSHATNNSHAPVLDSRRIPRSRPDLRRERHAGLGQDAGGDLGLDHLGGVLDYRQGEVSPVGDGFVEFDGCADGAGAVVGRV